ncbi:MAG: DoxX family protein [Lutibacter sp.]|nr:DoxX family protein [Lutibacter sp.]MBP9599906.1 DoxX family protein [Lutibacter sp.]
MKILVVVSRLFVAITFIFSGFVKLVDPLGSSYKFQEYFSAYVLDLEFLIPYALPFSIVLILAEIMLGVMLLVGYRPKLTVWSLLLLMFVFLFLTWYSAYYNKVTDCGCFGDAVELSAWGTFYKNIFLIVFVFILVWKSKLIKPLVTLNFARWTTFLSLLSFLYLSYYVLVHLPIIDFRPYAIGKSIPEGMEFKGEDLPPIHDFYLESSDGENLTDAVLAGEKIMLVVINTIGKSDRDGFSKMKLISDKALKEGYTVYALSSSLNEEFNDIKEEFDFKFDMLFCDQTTLKTVIRANPGVVILNKGIVKDKRNWVDVEKIKL